MVSNRDDPSGLEGAAKVTVVKKMVAADRSQADDVVAISLAEISSTKNGANQLQSIDSISNEGRAQH